MIKKSYPYLIFVIIILILSLNLSNNSYAQNGNQTKDFRIVSVNPPNDVTDVGIHEYIEVTFNKPVNKSSFEKAFLCAVDIWAWYLVLYLNK